MIQPGFLSLTYCRSLAATDHEIAGPKPGSLASLIRSRAYKRLAEVGKEVVIRVAPHA